MQSRPVPSNSSGRGIGFGSRLRLAVGLTLALVAPLAVPSCLASDQVIVITPHNRSICHEFGRAFSRWHEAEFGTPAGVDWRTLGGTSDALKFVQSEYAAKPGGIGVDLFFGGGPEPCLLLTDKQWTEPCEVPAAVLDAIPRVANGVEIYDARHRWFGAALSSFGILQSTRLQHRLGLPFVRRWEELANPSLFGWVGAGDPRNSGTMNNMFEAFLQAYGWERGWELLTAIAGNIRRFDRLSSTTAKDVTLGETAYAFAIDFYAFSQVAAAGRTNLTFVLPDDFTAISIDGICVLKGAPHAEAARRFVQFVLGETGQRLWMLPRGHPDGPAQYSIERLPVRPDLYRRYRDTSNIAISPFDLNQSFRYDSRLARDRREIVAALAGALLVDTESELREAWRAIIHRGAAASERSALGRMPISATEALAIAMADWKDPGFRNRQKLAWQIWAQQKYQRLARGNGRP